MGRVVDSSIVIRLERRGLPPEYLLQLVPDEPLALAAISASELLTGVYRADSPQRRAQRAAFVESVFGLVIILPFDQRIARIHAEVWAQLTMQGRMIGFHDLIIAATALAHGYSLLTDNVREFARVPGLTVVRPEWTG